MGEVQPEDSKKQEILHSCDQCEYVGSKPAVYQHKRSQHDKIRYPCDQCEYASTQYIHLKIHKENIHQGHSRL